MKMSHRAKRMQRFQKRGKGAPLNLVSLMDIFTILVFFLLVSSSSVQQLPSTKDIKLPTSIAKKAPKETIVIMVTADSIVVEGRKVADVNEIMASKEEIIPGLVTELKFQEGKLNNAQAQLPVIPDPANPAPPNPGKSVTIMGDENTSYDVLKRVLATCRQANFRKIAFAAMQKAKG